MSVQEAVTNAIANLFGSKAVAFIGVIAVAALVLGADQIPRVFDTGVPWRQLMAGRNLQSLALSFRFSWIIGVSYVDCRRPPARLS